MHIVTGHNAQGIVTGKRHAVTSPDRADRGDVPAQQRHVGGEKSGGGGTRRTRRGGELGKGSYVAVALSGLVLVRTYTFGHLLLS